MTRPTSRNRCRIHPLARGVRALLATFAACTLVACSDASSPSSVPGEPTLCDQVEPADVSTASPGARTTATGTRPVPAWFDDAKLGIMVHWGVWAVPGWAETTLDPERVADKNDPDYLLAPGGIERFVRHNPYTEWYQNSLTIDGTETQRFHNDTYGADFPYTGFQPLFEQQSKAWHADDWARLFATARARYVVFVSKHHDGYTLWPSSVPNPQRPGWNAPRDFVGEIADAARARCMRLGIYYSGGIDWSFRAPPVTTLVEFANPVPSSAEYARYVEDQYRELIARYHPSVLWNDITSPPLIDEAALFADYYAAVPDGVVNDRWGFDPNTPVDFRTAEYDVSEEISSDKWEAVRGIGRTFGYNVNETVEQYGTPEKYIHLLADVVSKNGNLLLNVGPMADGTIPAPQVAILEQLGAWLDRNGAAIFGTRPWTRFGGTTADDVAVRFTQSADGRTVYAIVLGTPAGTSLALRDFAENVTSVRRLDGDTTLDFARDGADLRIELGKALPGAAAHAFALTLG
jgi:alpha-L-fucosidase